MIIEVTLDLDELGHVVRPFLEDLITKEIQSSGSLDIIECRPIIDVGKDALPACEKITFAIRVQKKGRERSRTYINVGKRRKPKHYNQIAWTSEIDDKIKSATSLKHLQKELQIPWQTLGQRKRFLLGSDNETPKEKEARCPGAGRKPSCDGMVCPKCNSSHISKHGYRQIDGQSIQQYRCVDCRYRFGDQTKTKKSDTAEVRTPDITPAPVVAVQPPEPVKKEEPPTLNRTEMDKLIWDMYNKEHLTPDDISEKLMDMGYIYSERSVQIRLISQGAKIDEPEE
jgi:hypothetical protein